MNVYGYCRVSTQEQNEDRQLIAFSNLDIPQAHIYTDKQSGKDFARPMYQALIKAMQAGDVLYVKSIDRLGRNYDEILAQWRILTKERGVDIVVIDMPMLDTRIYKDLIGTFISDLVLQVLSFVAHTERETIKQRQSEGIAAAKARGVKFGRPQRKLPENFEEIVMQWERKQIPLSVLLAQANLAKSTFYRRLQAYRMQA